MNRLEFIQSNELNNSELMNKNFNNLMSVYDFCNCFFDNAHISNLDENENNISFEIPHLNKEQEAMAIKLEVSLYNQRYKTKITNMEYCHRVELRRVSE